MHFFQANFVLDYCVVRLSGTAGNGLIPALGSCPVATDATNALCLIPTGTTILDASTICTYMENVVLRNAQGMQVISTGGVSGIGDDIELTCNADATADVVVSFSGVADATGTLTDVVRIMCQ